MFLATLLIIVLILISFSIHEFSHAWVANRLGDPTARLDGRLSLNPIAHWDPLGTTLLVGLLILRGLGIPTFVFGWGKPVPINERYFANHKTDSAKTALAGPLSNILIAIVLSLLIRFVFPPSSLLAYIAVTGISINIFLAIFNLIPIPPLDGSRLLRIIIPDAIYERFEQSSSVLVILLMVILFTMPDFLGSIVNSIVNVLVP